MKLKIIVKIAEKLLGIANRDQEPRADMYLPERLLAMGLLFLAGGTACAVFAVFTLATWAIVGAVFGIVLGFFALLCFKNQTIHVISDSHFTYTTMFGNTHTYAFSDIQGLRKNQDSLTLLVANKKVHIESMAVLSKRLVERINRALAQNTAYLKLSAAELAQLPDAALFEAVCARTENIVSSKADLSEGFHALNDAQRVFYAVNYLEMEVNNGGLCQFFVNSSRLIAPFVSEYMDVIGATAHKELFDGFISKHQIDINDLSSFDCDCVEDFRSQYEHYPFDEYDDAFYRLEPLQNHLIPFVKKHIEKF